MKKILIIYWTTLVTVFAYVACTILSQGWTIYILQIWQCSGGRWSVAFSASPGNLQELEEVLFSQFDITQSSGLLCLKVSSPSERAVTVSVCYCDAMLREIGLTSFLDHPVHLTNTEALFVQLKPKEALFLQK